MTNIVALICARGGSKGIANKNLAPLGGKSLLARAIDTATRVTRVARVVVSTDSEAIAEAARAAGADVPFTRPAELSRDDSPEWLVWRQALGFLREETGTLPDVLLVVPTTAPLRAVEDLDRCLDEFIKGGVDAVVTVTEARRNPYFNMVVANGDGTVRLVIPPSGQVRRRQEAPDVYDMTTVGYAAAPDFVMTRSGIFEGRVRSVIVPPERALDIDTPLDMEIAQCLLPK